MFFPKKNLAREKKRDFSGSQVFFPFFLFVLLIFCESEERRRRRSPTVIIPISPHPFSLAAPPFWAIGEMGMGMEAEGQFGSLVNRGIPGRVESQYLFLVSANYFRGKVVVFRHSFIARVLSNAARISRECPTSATASNLLRASCRFLHGYPRERGRGYRVQPDFYCLFRESEATRGNKELWRVFFLKVTRLFFTALGKVAKNT